jgi:tetratricopeptide (TPR) repeat protein
VLAAALLVVAILVAYANSFSGPFVFDDLHSITLNPTIRRLASADIWSPPADVTVSGRPLLNASLAFNHAIGGEAVRGYHVVNLTIHVLAALTLFGVMRRTFGGPRLRAQFGVDRDVTWAAFAVALLWALHPLATESVTYVIQRAESLMALCYLLTLYCFVAAAEAPRSRRWQVAGAAACAAGMATKETMVTAPLVVLLYDRVFVGGAWHEIWRRRRAFYWALAATWLLLAFLIAQTGGRAGTAGFSAGATPLEYALTQSRAIVRYLGLAVWPHPLVLDYGEFTTPHVAALLPFAALILVLAGAAFALARRAPAAGFALGAFALVLAPTSTFFPIYTEPVAEHRMYLPLAALCALAIAGLHRMIPRRMTAIALLAAACGLLTWQRNDVYRSERTLWQEAVRAAPGNPRARASLARALAASGDTKAAEAQFFAALALRPDHVDARRGLADLLTDQNRPTEAAQQWRVLLQSHPDDFIAHNALGNILFQQGDLPAAAKHFESAVRAQPDSAPAHNNLGCVYYEMGNLSAARTHEETALRLKPDYAEAYYNLGNTLARQNDLRAARAHYERALALQPDYAEAHANLGAVLQNLGERSAAIEHHRAALRLRPDFEFARKNLELLLGSPERH